MCQQVADCSTTKNSFLAWASTIDSSLIKSDPRTSAPFVDCNELWSTSGQVGTCCDTNKFKGFYDKRIHTSQNKWASYVVNMFRAHAILNEISKLVGSEVDAFISKLRSDPQVDPLELTDLQLKEIIKLPDNFKSGVAQFKNEAKICFKEMAALRSKVICYGCWAFGGSYVTTGSSSTAIPTFRVSPDSYNTIVAKCGHT